MPMTCERIDDQLSAYRDGALDGMSSLLVRSHLRRCPDCAAASAEWDELDLALRGALTAGAPRDYLTAAIMHRLPAMPPARSRGFLVRRRWRSLRWVVGAGCAALQATALWGAFRFGYVAGQFNRSGSNVATLSSTLPASDGAEGLRGRRGSAPGPGQGRAVRLTSPSFALRPGSLGGRREAAVAAQAVR